MTTHADICFRYQELAKFCEGIIPTKLDNYPEPNDMVSIIGDLTLLANKVDALIADYAAYVTTYTGYKIEPEYSRDQLFRSLDGNLLFHISEAADDLAWEAAQ